LLFILAFLYAAIVSFPEEIGVDRVIGELAENIIHHNLTVDRAVFDTAELGKYDGSTAEPYVRHCQYGYYLEVEDLEKGDTVSCQLYGDCCNGYTRCGSGGYNFCNDVCGLTEDNIFGWDTATTPWQTTPDGNCACYSGTCQCREDMTDPEGWVTSKSEAISEAKFGYNTEESFDAMNRIGLKELGTFYNGNVIKEVTKDYYVSVADGDTVKPAKMTLTVSDTWLSRVSCLVEKAHYTKKPKSMDIDCLSLYPVTRDGKCWLPIRKSGDDICIFYQNPVVGGEITDIDCRNLSGRNLLYFDYPYQGAGILVAIPIKPGHGLNTDETYGVSEDNCERIETNRNWVAGEGDDVDTVLLCIREDFSSSFVQFLDEQSA
jgi:hypothetical protein